MKGRPLHAPVLGAALACSAGLFAWSGCRKAEVPTALPSAPSVRLYFLSTVAGALEPCGCRKDMLGGIDHAAALLDGLSKAAPHRLLLAAGPTLFQNPELEPERRDQDLWKAEALAASLADVRLAAWAPGVNDLALGPAVLRRLVESSGAKLVASNLSSPGELPAVSTALFEVGNYKVGVAGIGVVGEAGAELVDPARALEAAAQTLTTSGAQIRVALIAARRGDGLRLAERVPGFDVVALGKPEESGDGNDAPFPPTLVGETLVVQAPNHLQALAYVDLVVRGDDFAFQDGMGLAHAERRQGLEGRVKELEQRHRRWLEEQKPDAEQVRVREADIARSRAQLAELERAAVLPDATRSIFRYELLEVREGAGSDPTVARRMSEYYRRVNEHNREAFKVRIPEKAPEGSAHYVGQASCVSCHEDADTFWRTTRHAEAYETLSDEFKEFNLDCVGCHVTGYNRPGGSTVTYVDAFKDVQCESCHGPGSRHVDASGDTRFITLTPEPNVCRSCHHAPHVEDAWDLDQAWRKIIGPGHGVRPAATAP